MQQVYEQTFGRLKGTQLTVVTDGHAYLLQVPFAAFGFIAKVLAQQVSGTGVAFTVDALNSALGLTPGEIDPASLPAGWQLARVMDTLSADAGTLASYYTPFGQPYRNQDGADPVRSGAQTLPGTFQPAYNVPQAAVAGTGQTSYTNAQRCFYLLLQPSSGAGASAQWEVSVACWNDVR